MSATVDGPDPMSVKQELYTNWQIQESLLQSYRGLFVMSESVVLGISATQTGSWPSFFALMLLGVVLIVYWRSTCRARADAVSYWQKRLLDLEVSAPWRTFSRFKEWQRVDSDSLGVGRTIAELLALSRPMAVNYDPTMSGVGATVDHSPTRGVMELTLPRWYALVWVLLGTYTVLRAIDVVRA